MAEGAVRRAAPTPVQDEHHSGAPGADQRCAQAQVHEEGAETAEADQTHSTTRRPQQSLAGSGEAPRKRPAQREKPHIKFASKRATTWLRYWHDDSQHHYFVHPSLGTTQWTLPPGDAFEDASSGVCVDACGAAQHAQHEQLPEQGEQGAASAAGAGSNGAAQPSAVRQDPAAPETAALPAPRERQNGSSEHAVRVDAEAGASGAGRGGGAAAETAKGPARGAETTGAGGCGAICHLCQRKFKTVELLRRHEAMSDLHRQKVAEAKACVPACVQVRALARARARAHTHTHTHSVTQAQ